MTTEEAGLWEEEEGALVAGSCQLGLAASWTSSLGWCVCWPELPPGLLLRTALSPAEGTGCCEGDVSDGDVSDGVSDCGSSWSLAAILAEHLCRRDWICSQDFRLLLLGGPSAAPEMILSSAILPLTLMAHYC